MSNIIDYLNEEGTRELIEWTNELSKKWEKSFDDLTIEDIENAFNFLDSDDPLYSEIEQLINSINQKVESPGKSSLSCLPSTF